MVIALPSSIVLSYSDGGWASHRRRVVSRIDSGSVLMSPRRNAPAPISTPTGGKLIAFGWYGGKFSHLDWLLPLLPGCHHYCEPFAGSAAVLLNRSPSPIETYNDLDGEVANFFRVLRDQKNRTRRTNRADPLQPRRVRVGLSVRHDGRPSGTRPALLRPRPPSANRAGTDGEPGAMGQLQEHQSGRHERG